MAATAWEAMLLGAPIVELADLIRRPAWMRDALCLEHPEVVFFPTRGESTAEAKAVCRRCAVRDDCLGYALEQPLWGDSGVWGGTSARDRRKLRTGSRGAQEAA